MYESILKGPFEGTSDRKRPLGHISDPSYAIQVNADT